MYSKLHLSDPFFSGREAQTQYLNLESIGVEIVPGSYKIKGNNEQTTVPNIYAIGDVLHVRAIIYTRIHPKLCFQ